jgi:hypothetical protein
MASTAAAIIDGNPHVWVIGSDGRIYERWPDPAADGRVVRVVRRRPR